MAKSLSRGAPCTIKSCSAKARCGCSGRRRPPRSAGGSRAPPEAPALQHESTYHGVTLSDPYTWLKDPGYPEVTDKRVLGYLKAENAYFESVMAPHEALTKALFQELKGRIKEDDASVPVKEGDFLYHWRYETGAEYSKWYRSPAAGGAETLILDEPALAEGHDYFVLRDLEASPDGALLAYSTDTDGSERFTVRVKDLAAGRDLPEAIANTSGTVI